MFKSVTVNTAGELGEALADKIDEIRIEGDLAKRVRRIRTIGVMKWMVIYSALGAAVVAAISGVGLPAAILLAGAAVAVLGYDATVVAIYIGVAAKGAGVLKVLRKDYREVARGVDYLVLKRR